MLINPKCNKLFQPPFYTQDYDYQSEISDMKVIFSTQWFAYDCRLQKGGKWLATSLGGWRYNVENAQYPELS